MDDPAETMRTRLRAGLSAAMKARDADATRALRALVAAIDQAQTVDVGRLHDRYEERAFGDPGVEVPRRRLGAEDLAAILQRERDERLSAADELDRVGAPERAERLRAEAAVIDRQLGD